jgi:hypothetical protein
MSLQSFIDNLSQKPEHIRKRYSFLFSFTITAIIFTFWISSLSLPNYNTDQNLADVINKVDTPGQSLVASVGSLFTDVKDIVFGPKKVTYSSLEVVPGRK